MHKSTIEIVTLMNTTYSCLFSGDGADFMGRMLFLVILRVGACGHSCPASGEKFGSAGTRMALHAYSPKLSKQTGPHEMRQLELWEAKCATAEKTAARPLSSLTVGIVPFSSDIDVRRNY